MRAGKGGVAFRWRSVPDRARPGLFGTTHSGTAFHAAPPGGRAGNPNRPFRTGHRPVPPNPDRRAVLA